MSKPKALKIADGVMAAAAILALVGLLWYTSAAPGPFFNLLYRIANIVLIAMVMAHVIMHFLMDHGPRHDIRLRMILSLVTVAPLATLASVAYAGSLIVIVRQVVLWCYTLSRVERIQRLVAALGLHPAHMLIGSFAGAILIGSFFLALPVATADGVGLPVVDAVFTATSATCVTGLIVRSTGNDFTLFGQLVILFLVQVGGLGIMTFSVWVLLAAGKTLRMRQEALMSSVLDQEAISGIVDQIRFILGMTLIFELAGAVALFFLWRGGPGLQGDVHAAYAAVFHAVSAFCNAGFSLFDSSLIAWRGNLPVNIVFWVLIVGGGIGFHVVRDIWRHLRGTATEGPNLRMQTRLVLRASAVLIVVGAVLFYVSERGGVLRGMPFREQVYAAVFQSVTARTAGFNTVEITRVADGTRLFLVVLMFVGASPGSTGGGIKTTTFWIVLNHALAAVRNRGRVEVGRRTIPPAVVQKAACIGLLAAAFLFSGTFALMLLKTAQTTAAAFHGLAFSDILFEATSALGTVGLSTGATATLTPAAKWVVVVLMFAGRLGPLTIALAVAGAGRQPRYEYAEEHVAVG